MKIGYARVSTADQNLDLQMDALRSAGCERIYCEKASGKSKDRPELQKMMDALRPGDVLVIWKLDRIGRSVLNLIELVNELGTRGVGLVSLTDPIDTTTPAGRMVFGVFASLAQYEREIIIERTRAGMAAAAERGRVGGRPAGVSKRNQVALDLAKRLIQDGATIGEISNRAGVSERTVADWKSKGYLN